MQPFEVRAIAGIDYSVEEVTVVRWYKFPGESIKKGEALACLDVVKTEIDFESPVDGVLLEHCLAEGESGPRGVLLARIETAAVEPPQAGEAAPKPRRVQSQVRTGEGKERGRKERPVAPARPAAAPERTAANGRRGGAGARERGARAAAKPSPGVSRAPAEAGDGSAAAAALARLAAAEPQAPPATDRARAASRRLGVDLTQVQPTGLRGRVITAADVERAHGAVQPGVAAPVAEPTPPAAEPPRAVPLLPRRRHEARLLAHSHVTIPAATSKVRIALKWAIEATKARQASFLHAIASAAAYLLKDPRFAYFNGYVTEDGRSVVAREHVGLGFAVARPYEEGLLVTVVKEAETKSFRELVEAIQAHLARAQQPNPPFEDLTGLTFTINNTGLPRRLQLDAAGRYQPRPGTGPHADLTGTSIIPWAVEDHPTTAILSFGAYDPDDPLKTAIFSLTFDHRLIDGLNLSGERLGAIEFLVSLKTLLESEEFLADLAAEVPDSHG
ncbi:MAG: 2-oxo acid dehydrogenase subunit E2 [Candidatus Tectomicrobia bacterium]|nr:2-oxo acid dehydrogenase subunit E2 [Candidatus Tectomicrobia bacterium]